MSNRMGNMDGVELLKGILYALSVCLSLSVCVFVCMSLSVCIQNTH